MFDWVVMPALKVLDWVTTLIFIISYKIDHIHNKAQE